MSSRKIEIELEKRLPQVRARRNVPARALTTLGVGGAVNLLLEPSSPEELSAVLQVLQDLGCGYRVLGAGSNLLIADEGISTPVLRTGRGFRLLRALEEEGGFVVGAAMPVMQLARELSGLGWGGLEFAGGIPASMGGAVTMNAGAHGGEFGGVVQSVFAAAPTGEISEIPASQISFSYRHAALSDGAIVTAVKIGLMRGDPIEVERRLRENLDYRRKTQPLQEPSCGSVFRNPSPSRTAGSLIEDAGLKGISVGGASISTLHANWIINRSRQATAADVFRLIELCQDRVESQFGITLIPEVVHWED